MHVSCVGEWGKGVVGKQVGSMDDEEPQVRGCRSAISVGEARVVRSTRTASVPDSSATLSQCLLTAPLHCLPVPPVSSATLSPGRCVTLLLPSLLASARFCRGVGEGSEGSRLEAWMKSHKSEVAIT